MTHHAIGDSRFYRRKGPFSVWTTLQSFLPEAMKDKLYARSSLASILTAGLEMVKQGKIEIKQDGLFRPIYMRATVEKFDELEILKEIAQGRTNAAVGERLFISEKSVQKYINSMFAKLGLIEDGVTNRRVRAVLLYLNAS